MMVIIGAIQGQAGFGLLLLRSMRYSLRRALVFRFR